MKTQTYYNTVSEKEADICNLSRELCVNCAGAVDESVEIFNSSVRKDFYLMYITDGSMSIELDGKQNILNTGNMLIIAPGTHYRYRSGPGQHINYLWIHFTGMLAADTLEYFGLTANNVSDTGIHSTMFEKWQRLFGEFILNDEYFYDTSSWILKEIFAAFSRYLRGKSSSTPLFRSILYIHEHFSSEITVPYLAYLENMSETHYRLCFRRATGASPIQYIIN
ncbi:MAG: AraC family ligand binding domain-containing protein [Firmicutes bacterium]|nr:AraC family ligand binding domain-containing protein [Bacillota bacterium]